MANLTRTSLRLFMQILLFHAGCCISWAQGSGTVSGTVRSDNNPVEFVNVYVTLAADSSNIISGEITDSLGNFVLSNLPFATYTLNFQLIGFVKKQIPFSLSSTRTSMDIGLIQLELDVQLLSAVEVTAMRSMKQKTEDGFVVTASENITQIGGTAAD